MAEVLVNFFDNLLVQAALDKVIQVDFGPRIHDAFEFVQNLIVTESTAVADFGQWNFAIDGPNDKNPVAGFGTGALDHKALGFFDIVFFDIAGNKLHKRLAEFEGFAWADPYNLLHFGQGGGVHGRHFFEGGVLEDDIGGETLVFG